MAGPITWRNVSGGDLSAALSALRGTQASMGNMFSGLQETLKNYQEGRSQSAQDEFLNALYGQYRSPDALDAAIQSGAINNLISQHGSYLDRGAAHLAARDYLDTLRKSAVTGMQHADEVAMRDQRGAFNQALLASTRGNYGEVDNFFSQHPDAVRGDALIEAMHAARLANNSDSRASAQHQLNMANLRQQMEHRAAQEARSNKEFEFNMGRAKTKAGWEDEEYDRKKRGLVEKEHEDRAELAYKRSLGTIANLLPEQQIEATRQLEQAIANSYNIPPDKIHQWRSDVKEGLTTPPQLYGEAALRQAAAAQLAEREEADWRANSPAAVGSREAMRNQDELVKWISGPAGTGLSDNSKAMAIQALGEIFDEVHITLPDGTKIGPTQEIIKSAFLKAGPSIWNWDRTRKTTFKKEVEKMMNKSSTRKQLIERWARDQAQIDKDTVNLTRVLNELRETDR